MKKINKLATVTVAVSIFNEEKNIVNFLKSVLIQEETNFCIKEILIYIDGSTDRSVERLKKFKDKRIKIFEDKVRRGKSYRLNQIYSCLKTDILVQTDADVIFANELVINSLIGPLIKYKKVAMTGGHPQPKKGETFIENAVNFSFEAYSKFRKEVRGGNNIFSADGRLLAYKKELVKKITIPETMIANDAFTYFCCLTSGYKYKYVSSAVVLFRSPQKLKDHLKQNIRFEAAPIRLKRYFSEALVTKEKLIPKETLIRNFLIQFFKSPIHCSFIFLINIYCRYQAWIIERQLTAKWSLAKSTKTI